MDTSITLLESLKPGADPEAWTRLVDLYAPLIRHWLIRHGAKADDAGDVIQGVVCRGEIGFQKDSRIDG